MISKAAIDSARRAAILARAPLYPKGACHYDGHRLARGALWCAQDCADKYAKERADLLEPKSLVLGVVKGEATVPLVATNIHGAADTSPLQLISAGLLTYYQRLEAAMRVFLTTSQIEQIKLQAGHPGAPVEA